MRSKLFIRPMLHRDIDTVFKWRTNPLISQYMLSEAPVSFESHLNWYTRTTLDKNKALLIADYSGKAVGFVQFDNVLAKKKTNWGFYKDPDSLKGLGRIICVSALDYGFNVLNLKLVCGQVLIHNIKSINLHLGIGFTEINSHNSDKHETNLRYFEMRASDWIIHSGNINAKYNKY